MNMSTGNLYILSGPSGVGKTTLCRYILEIWGTRCGIERAKSYTTRLSRGTDDTEYFFITPEDFARKEQENFFIETTEIYGNNYGLGKDIQEQLIQGKSLVAITDTRGAQKIIAVIPTAIALWIDVSDDKILAQRLLNRGTEATQDRFQRIEQRVAERAKARASGIYKYFILNNTHSMAHAALNSIFARCLI